MIQDNSFIQAIHLPVNNSPWPLLYIGGVHSGAMVLLFATGLPLILRGLCCIAILVHGIYWLLQFMPGFTTGMARELLLTPAGEWWLWDDRGTSCRAELEPDAFISPLLLVLRFQTNEGVRHAFIHADRVNSALLRRLRVRLLHTES